MATTISNEELVALEHEYWRALRDKDIARMTSLTDDPCIVTGAQGVGRIDKRTFVEMMKSARWTLRDFELKDMQVQQLGDDVAVVAYKVHEDLTVEGAPLSLDAADASTWVRRDGRWLCALHTESIAGDPYGRDRK